MKFKTIICLLLTIISLMTFILIIVSIQNIVAYFSTVYIGRGVNVILSILFGWNAREISTLIYLIFDDIIN